MGARASLTRRGPSPGRFDRIFSEGRRASGALVQVIGLPTPADLEPALGFAVSRKVGCHARRNRLRRRLREAARASIAVMRSDLDYVVSAGEPAAEATFAAIVADLAATLPKVGPRWPASSSPDPSEEVLDRG